MRRRIGLLLFLLLFPYPSRLPQLRLAAQEPAAVDKKSTPDKPAADPASQSPAPVAPKPKKVITNDDIKSSPFVGFGGAFYVSAGSINDCDESCFDGVRVLSNTWIAGKDPGWRTELLRQIDVVRSDSEWQAYLRQLYDAHSDLCQLSLDRQDELNRSGNNRDLGPLEIAIAEKYDRKLDAARAALAHLVSQQSTLQRKFATKPYANAFANSQVVKMNAGSCSQRPVIIYHR